MLFCLTISDPVSAIRCLLPRHSDLCWSCKHVCFYTATHDISMYMHIAKKKKKAEEPACAHKNILTHFTEAVGEPECRAWGLLCFWCSHCLLCRPSACRRLLHIYAWVQPCIIKSDCCGQQVTGQESSKAKVGRVGGEGGKDRRRLKDHWVYLFPQYLFTYYFLLFLGSALILYPQTSAPWVTSCQTAKGGCRLSSYPRFSHFLAFGIHIVLHPGNHLGTLGNWTEATQI